MYDPLGLASPSTLVGKQIYRDACDSKIPWGADLNGKLLQRWEKWERSLSPEVVVPRSIVSHQEEVTAIELHTFEDASIKGVGAAVYAVVKQSSGTTQQLVTAKEQAGETKFDSPETRIGCRTYGSQPRGECISNALPKDQSPSIYAWVDSLVVLHWICGQGTYKQFVANRMAKIHAPPKFSGVMYPRQLIQPTLRAEEG